MGCETEGEWIEEARRREAEERRRRENEGWHEVQGGDEDGKKARVYLSNPRGGK
jgi:hypothetical protein